MRAIWSGTLSFGLINIPVKLFSAARERAMNFHLFDKKDNCPISFKKVCRLDDHPVDQKDIIKGYEYEKGQYVMLSKDDFKKANARKTGTVDIKSFTDVSGIDERYFDKPYFVLSEDKSAKAYILLRDAMKETGKAAVATYVLRDKEHVTILKPQGELLVLLQLRFKDELVDPDDLKIPATAKYSKREMDMAKSLVNSLEEPFDPAAFKDTYSGELRRIIEAKAKGKKIEAVGSKPAATSTDMATMLNLLERSLKQK